MVCVEDDGRGLGPAAGALRDRGLANMRERLEALDGTLADRVCRARSTPGRAGLPLPSGVLTCAPGSPGSWPSSPCILIADIAISASYRTLFSEASVAEHGFPFLTGAVVLTGVLGAVIVSRYGRHPIGWLLTLIGLTGSFSLLGEAYSIWVLTADGPGTRLARRDRSGPGWPPSPEASWRSVARHDPAARARTGGCPHRAGGCVPWAIGVGGSCSWVGSVPPTRGISTSRAVDGSGPRRRWSAPDSC